MIVPFSPSCVSCLCSFKQRSQLLPQLGDNVRANVCAKDREEREEGVGGVERREGVGGGGIG